MNLVERAHSMKHVWKTLNLIQEAIKESYAEVDTEEAGQTAAECQEKAVSGITSALQEETDFSCLTSLSEAARSARDCDRLVKDMIKEAKSKTMRTHKIPTDDRVGPDEKPELKP
jgi:hypothetical protein